MPQFGAKSLEALHTCHPDLQTILRAVIPHYDFTVLEGKRSEAQQAANVAKGVSQTMQSKHVYPLDAPSRAVDIAPYPLQWPQLAALKHMVGGAGWEGVLKEIKALCRFYYLQGQVKHAADREGVAIRQGIDWDGDGDFTDQTFDDAPHVELR